MRIIRRALWPLACVMAVGLGAGTVSASAVSVRLGPQHGMIVTEQSPTVLRARAGQPIEIRLRAQPGTGYSWVAVTPSKYLTSMKSIPGTGIPGGWQTQRFRFLAKKPGTYYLVFSYDQPWRGGTKGARRKTFTIKVK